MPQHIKLVGLENEVLHRNPTPLRLLPIFELLPQVLLKRQGKIDLVQRVEHPL